MGGTQPWKGLSQVKTRLPVALDAGRVYDNSVLKCRNWDGVDQS